MSVAHDIVTVPAGDADGASSQPPAAPLPPLTVSALMVTKADLIAALRVYLPQLSDIEAIDGERFLLSVGASPADGEAT